jgi:DNA-directed RNA polymerase subunit L
MRYQLTKALPWWFSRWVLQRKNAVLELLYHFDHSTDQSRINATIQADKKRADGRAENGSRSGIQFENNYKDTTSSTIQEKTG